MKIGQEVYFIKYLGKVFGWGSSIVLMKIIGIHEEINYAPFYDVHSQSSGDTVHKLNKTEMFPTKEAAQAECNKRNKEE